jgi:glycosyltransferase involved in cell wall biosynthesis
MLGLGQGLAADCRSIFLSFAEGGRCRPFLEQAEGKGFDAVPLRWDTPHFWKAVREIASHLERVRADALCCHGYKADLLGRVAARRTGIPAVAVSRGWTGESARIRFYEFLDRRHLYWMDHVVCVSAAQAERVRRAGAPDERVSVIRNAIVAQRFQNPRPAYRTALQRLFTTPRRLIVGGAGRLSPEKGFGVLVDAAARLVARDPTLGFVLFGDGPLREELAGKIRAAGVGAHFVLAGFRDDLDSFLPFFDLLVLPSYTEGLPNVVLEAMAAGVPVVASAVGGTPEILTEAESGYLVPAGDVDLLADRIQGLLESPEKRRVIGRRGRQRVEQDFTFAAQAIRYRALFCRLRRRARSRGVKATSAPVEREAASGLVGNLRE